MRIVILLAALVLPLLTGCASTTPTIESNQLAGLQIGKTTYPEVVKRFGRPSFDSPNMDGTRTSGYLHEGSRSESSSLVSLIGAIAAGPNAKPDINAVVFRFDAYEKLTGYTRYMESDPNTVPQAAATGTPAQPASQPASVGSPSAKPSAASPATAPSGTALPATNAAPAATTTTTTSSIPAAATSAVPAQPAAKPAQKPRPRRTDGLPDWLPSSDRDARDPVYRPIN